MIRSKQGRVLVTGGATFLGINIASALLAEGADVTLIIRDGNQSRLGLLGNHVQIHVADVWDFASIKGRARGHETVIHTVGSLLADPSQGLTYDKLNLMSARHVANMCISDGVSHFVLMSAARAPWVNPKYIQSKRAAEQHVRRAQLKTSIVRAPLTYMRGTNRPLFYRLMTALGQTPPIRWTPFANIVPMPLDILARATARIALNPPDKTHIYRARDCRRLNTRDERRGSQDTLMAFQKARLDNRSLPFEVLEDEVPFGWMPPNIPLNDDMS